MLHHVRLPKLRPQLPIARSSGLLSPSVPGACFHRTTYDQVGKCTRCRTRNPSWSTFPLYAHWRQRYSFPVEHYISADPSEYSLCLDDNKIPENTARQFGSRTDHTVSAHHTFLDARAVIDLAPLTKQTVWGDLR
jgi:hypothetical protein